MSDSCRVKALLSGLLVIHLGYIHGLHHDCSVCCVIQDKFDLNCSWRSDASDHSVSLRHPDSPPLLFDVPFGQNWLLIPRDKLTRYNEYNITVTGGGKKKSEHFTEGGLNLFIRPPLLSSALESDSLEIMWSPPEDEELEQRDLQVELRYRILGADNWTKVNESDLEISTYVMDNPKPDTDYEFQIRYLKDATMTKGSLWSESHIVRSPEVVPNGRSHVWRRLQDGSSHLVMWKPLDLHSAGSRNLTYQVTYTHGDKERTIDASCCRTTLPDQSTEVCVRAKNPKGTGPPACVPPLCTGMTDKTVLDCSVQGNTGGISVSCKELQKSDHVLSYVTEWTEDETMAVHWTRSQEGHETLLLPGDFTPGVPYVISVYVPYNHSCARTFSAEVYSQEEAPTAAPNFTSQVLSEESVLVSWEEIPKQQRRGIISHYTIYVKTTERLENHSVSNESGHKILSGLSSGTIHTIWMTASTRAGEGQPGPHKTFQTSATGSRHRVLLVVAVAAILLSVSGVGLCFCDCKISLWPKIPKPEDKLKKIFMASTGNMWQPQQISHSPIITVVEEMEPPPSPPPPPPSPPPPSQPLPQLNPAPVITSGYEKHFMPSPEEILAFQ
ncbi:interleukin-27 receptor subunit alpha [Leptodactylus fuscus]|uniref:interleukin-27 receptor subunit alpha n=1 Tax=Leptodactylus fuscus TaxID=238119 RepID=UPI003F4E7F2D